MSTPTTHTYKSISDLSSATTINDDDILLISQHDGEQLISKKTTIEKLVDDVVQPIMEDYLPLAAGPTNVVNGTIYSSNPNATLRHNDINSAMRIVAGPYMSDSQNDWLPAELILHHSGKADGTDKSQFELHTHRIQGSTNTKYTTTLRGTCDGKLTWDTKNIVRSVNNISATSNGNLNIDTIQYANKLKTARKIELKGDATGHTIFDGSKDIAIIVNVLSSDYAQKSLSAATSDKLKTAKTVKLSGDLNGSFSFDGSKDIAIIVNVLSSDYAQKSLSAATSDKLKTARNIRLSGDLSGSFSFDGSKDIAIIVNVLSSDYAQKSLSAATSDKLKTARNIRLSGDLSGSFSFDGNNNITANVNVNDNSHNHTISNITNLSTILSSKCDKTDFRCDDGEILYPQQDGTFRKNTIMDNSLVVDSPEDLSACINSKPSYENIFNKFKVFVNSGTNKAVLKGYRSSFNTVYNTLSSESHPLSSMYYDIASINYDSGLNTIVQSRNSQFPNGFVSPNKYSDYDITIRCYSPYASMDDGDSLGLIAAYAEDENGVPVYLTFTRTAPFSNASLQCFSTSSGGYTSLNARNTCIPSFSYIDGKNKVQSYTDKVNSSGMQWICGINTIVGCADLHTQTNHVVSIIDGNVKYGKDSPNIWTTVLADGSGTLRFENDVNPNEIQYDPSKVYHPVSPTASNNIFGDFARPRSYHWDDFRSGFLIRVIRSGNKFTATTSELEQRETSSNVSQNHTNHGLKLKDYTKIEIDLDELLADERITEDVKKTLRLFTTKASYGFFNSSSPYSTYELINIDIPETTIVNMMDNTVMRKINGTWKVIDGLTPSDYVGRGRLSYNYITHKLFYSSEIDNDIYQVGQF